MIPLQTPTSPSICVSLMTISGFKSNVQFGTRLGIELTLVSYKYLFLYVNLAHITNTPLLLVNSA